MNTKRVVMTVITVTVLALVFATTAIAQSNRPGNRDQQPRGPRIAFGEIIALDSSSITIRPEIPEEMAERMSERGRELPELPAELTFTLDDQTEYYTVDGDADSTAFNIGDTVVIRPGFGEDNSTSASMVASEEAARQFIGDRLGQHFPGADGLGRPGMGAPDGERGSRSERGRNRPAFGSILSMDATSITIKPEIPEAFCARIPADMELPELPEEMVIGIDEHTKFYTLDGEVDSAEFAVGEQVVIRMAWSESEQPVAAIIADLEAAKEFLRNLGERGQGRGDGPSHGNREGRGQRGGNDGPGRRR